MAQKNPAQECNHNRNKRKKVVVQALIKGMGVAVVIMPVEVVEVNKRSS